MRTRELPRRVRATLLAIGGALRTEDGGPFPIGAAYSCLLPNRDADAFIAVAPGGSSAVTLDHPALNNTPSATPFVQALDGVLNPHPVGVYYLSFLGRWQIRNLDAATIPAGKEFVVVVGNENIDAELEYFRHTVTSGNRPFNHVTAIDHPLLNGNPDLQPVVTQSIGLAGISNAHTIGAYYSYGLQRWAIFNQDFAALAPGHAFHVMVRRPCP